MYVYVFTCTYVFKYTYVSKISQVFRIYMYICIYIYNICQRLVGFSLPTFFHTIRFVAFLCFFLRAPACTLEMFPCFGCQGSRSETIMRIVHFGPTTIHIT